MGSDGWTLKRFNHCADLIRDTVRPSDVSGLPYIGLEHIAEGQLTLTGFGSAEQVTSIKSRFRKGDILFGKLRPYFRKVVIAPFDGVCSTDIWVVRQKQGIDQRYLFYWMASNEFIEESTRASEGTRMPRAQWEFVGRIEKSIPPLPEQRAIAHILGTLDDKIELNRRMNQTLEEMARAIFKSWFVDFDPVRAKAAVRREHPDWSNAQVSRAACPNLKPEIAELFPDEFENSELGEIPKEWRVGQLAELAGLVGGYAFKSKDWVKHGVPVVKIGSVKPGIVDLSDVSYVSHEVAREAQRYRLSAGDLLIGLTGYVGEVGLVPLNENPPLLNQRVGKFILEQPGTTGLAFLYCLTRQAEFRAKVEARSHGTAQANVSTENILSISIVVPPKSVRDKFNRIGRRFLDLILLKHSESRTLAALRDTLLPKLISGELRVKDAERFLKERGL